MPYARIQDGIVAEIIEPHPDGHPLEDSYHPDLLATFVECPADVELGMTYSGGAFGPAPAPLREPNEVIWARINSNRNALLQNSAWTQAPDEPEDVRERWATYRQKLRDITQGNVDPDTFKWPDPPET